MIANQTANPALFVIPGGSPRISDPVKARVAAPRQLTNFEAMQATVPPTSHRGLHLLTAARSNRRTSASRRCALLGRLPRWRLPAAAHRLPPSRYAKLARFTFWRKSSPCISTTTHISCSRERMRSPIRSPSVSSRIAARAASVRSAVCSQRTRRSHSWS